MKIWLIAGAFSGVGKTRLARELEKIVPGAVALKIGHGRRKKKGFSNFFTSTDEAMDFINSLNGKCTHCIIESNRLVGKLKADVVIFLDNLDGERRNDAGLLRRRAHIIIGHRGNPDQWKNRLLNHDLTSAIQSRMLTEFRKQHEYLCGSRLTLRTKLWFSRDGQVVFGEGLARLLHGIEMKGSLSAAVKGEDVSYRHAWGDIKRAEERLGFPLIERKIGGKSGGGARLTPKGKKFLEGYEILKRKTVRESDKRFRVLLEEIEAGG